jgi:D-alanine transfer protein
LPIYGSSELIKPSSKKAAEFFQSYPTGFAVSPVGKGGATSLIILQKLAAVGSELQGKKLAILVSPSWFLHESIPASNYNGNFSLLQAGEFIYCEQLSFDLRGEVARRMLQYPATLERSALLAFALKHVATNSALSRTLYYLTMPLGMTANAILRAEDHFATLFFIVRQWRALPVAVGRFSSTLDWSQLIGQATSPTREQNNKDRARLGVEIGPTVFAKVEESAQEWGDFELLLRGLNELGARPLLLSMPMNGRYFDRFGIGRETRHLYYKRISRLAQVYHTPLVDFEEHDEDEDFLVDHHDHLSDKGWLHYDRALDDFFHDRLATPASSLR